MSALTVHFTREDPNAAYPMKQSEFSIGYDLVAIAVHKKVNDTTTIFDTGLSVTVPSGYYFEIVSKECMCKTGYVLIHSIIQENYCGRIMFSMSKVDASMPDIQIPFAKCQLILRKAEPYVMVPAP